MLVIVGVVKVPLELTRTLSRDSLLTMVVASSYVHHISPHSVRCLGKSAGTENWKCSRGTNLCRLDQTFGTALTPPGDFGTTQCDRSAVPGAPRARPRPTAA
jgi:hypothetical protein